MPGMHRPTHQAQSHTAPEPPRPDRALQDKSRIAFGLAVICAVCILETVMADRRLPSAASPLVWALLGTLAVVAVALGLWWRRRAYAPVRDAAAASSTTPTAGR
jgi:hypothetical protein